VAEVKKLPLSDIPCKGGVRPGPQARGVTGQLHHPKFSKTCLAVRCNNKLQNFASASKYQLVAALRALVAGSLIKVLSVNLRDAPCFGIQFDETTDLGNDSPLHWQAQLITYVRFPDKERLDIVDL